MEKTLSMLGMARKAGSIEIGEEASGAAVRSGKAKVLMLAGDASDNAIRRAEGFVAGTNTPLISLPFTKLEISAATGKRGCSMAAVTDIGFAGTILTSLSANDADRYGAVLEDIRQKEQKARQRKKEALAHDRNKRHGKKPQGGKRTD